MAARHTVYTRVFSIDILTKQLTIRRMIDHPNGEIIPRNLNLCCKCLMPCVYYLFDHFDCRCFSIAPRRFKKDAEIFHCGIILRKSGFSIITRGRNIPFHRAPPSSILFEGEDKVLSVYEKLEEENGRIKTVLTNASNGLEVTYIPDNCVWHDITFLNDNYCQKFALTQTRNANNVTLRLFYLDNTDTTTKFQATANCTVDSNFPSFEASPFFLSHHSLSPVAGILKYDFIVFPTPAGIVTVPLRMLSLSETAFLTLCQIPEPLVLLSTTDDDEDVEQFDSKKKVTDRWMSLNYIKKTMRLSNKFDLV